MITVRKARFSDLEAIKAIVNPYENDGLLLFRPTEDLREHIKDFSVAVLGERIVGTGALHHYNKSLAEVRTLAVPKKLKGRGIGKKLVEDLMRRAYREKLCEVFVMTVVPDFFKKLGFKRVPHSALPEKVWKDCVKCAHYQRCDEIALLKEIDLK